MDHNTGSKMNGIMSKNITNYSQINMKQVIEALKNSALRDNVKVIIGGAPITQAYADEIHADGYAQDAASAVDLVRDLLA